MLAALVLRLLDVLQDDIVADYLPNAPATPRMVERFETWPRYRAHIAQTPPQAYAVEGPTLRAFLLSVDAMPGGRARLGRAA